MSLWTVFWTLDFADSAPDLVFYEGFEAPIFKDTLLRPELARDSRFRVPSDGP